MLADRFDKRAVLACTQVLAALPAALLWALTLTGSAAPATMYALGLVRGTLHALERPARETLPGELVGAPEQLASAVGLSQAVEHTTRILGPATAGLVIAKFGTASCFALNALTSLTMAIVVLRIVPPRGRSTHSQARWSPRTAIAELVAGWVHVRGRRELRLLLLALAITGVGAQNFWVLMPLLARQTWHGNELTYAMLTACLGAGCVLGSVLASLLIARSGTVALRLICWSAATWGVLELAVAAAPTLPLQLGLLTALGISVLGFLVAVNTHLQHVADPAVRGRVMGLWTLAQTGLAPIGAPLSGLLVSATNPRVGLAAAGLSALAAAAVVGIACRRR